MEIFETVLDLKEAVNELKGRGKTIGFSPTMGALHQGHASLLAESKKRDDISVCSIFVNPTQFNDKNDLKKYPKTLDLDIQILEDVGCDILFKPSAEEIYPENLEHFTLDLGMLDKVMEGEKRPGHFKGMVQVVKRLLDIVEPDQLYMGQKDFQQFTIVRHMIKTFNLPTRLVVCPIIREADGLAMSSRNLRLQKSIRSRAHNIYKTLKASKDWLKYIPVKYTKVKAMNALDITDFSPEYFEIVDGNTLLPVEDYRSVNYVVACTAVWAGDVRLIDNMIYRNIS